MRTGVGAIVAAAVTTPAVPSTAFPVRFCFDRRNNILSTRVNLGFSKLRSPLALTTTPACAIKQHDDLRLAYPWEGGLPGMCDLHLQTIGIVWLRMLIRSTAVLRLVCLFALCFTPWLLAESTSHGGDAALPSAGSESARALKIRPVQIIVGFMGGRVKPGNLLHKEATVAQNLRERGSRNLQVLVFANHDGQNALRTLLKLVDQDGDHKISDTERKAVEIAIYGHSWGASEAINLARSLQKSGIPVALTVQVDSVEKSGENDEVVPSNVRQAVNLFQRDGLLRGRASIRAEDAMKTRILVNEQYHYGVAHAIDISRFPWFARTFMRQHIMIENDPKVWNRVQGLLEQAVQVDHDSE